MKKSTFFLLIIILLAVGCVPHGLVPPSSLSNNPTYSSLPSDTSYDSIITVPQEPRNDIFSFEVEIRQPSGDVTGETLSFSMNLPQGWNAEGNDIFFSSSQLGAYESKPIVQVLAAYPKHGSLPEEITTRFQKAEYKQTLAVGNYSCEKYCMAYPFEERGITAIIKELSYFLDTGDYFIEMKLYPLYGYGGFSLFTNPFEAQLGSLQVHHISTDKTTEQQAVFALGPDGEKKTLTVGNTIGDWTLADLQINTQPNTGEINTLEAKFTGEVTLRGSVTRSVLVDLGFDFTVSDEDRSKMPYYISPEAPRKDTFSFMLKDAQKLTDLLNLSHEEKKECQITISSYCFIFAYTMAPATAEVVTLNLL